ncbi:putative bifunctional diguanylate cyclase/phosphodiesterase [Rugamonas sp. DEMB1]|uniref:putative bifunctional diguanylate cyclase/phosphodiesterase n=1 Tax=Rugamonas sp. DEMB1 TaxID=3039386 RepID=UPI002447D145|nr:bifunctional diguanylate cyclase/phosphodiesterase [Rugamonas sp. DEMB1]WGG49245.1 bifunctional diguanylate cyclase/phosphodiesterase [Rugamonas sp. DEMB1]
MKYLYFTNSAVLLMLGAVLLLVWWRHRTQAFARDLACSTMAAGLSSASYYFYRHAPPPYDQLAFAVGLCATILNLLFMSSGVMRLAGRRLHPAAALAMLAAMALVLILPSYANKLAYWPMVVLGVTCGLGALAAWWMRRASALERGVGPMLMVLGLNQLPLVYAGEEELAANLFLSTALRTALVCVLLFAALARSAREARKLSARFALLTEHSQQGVVVTDGQRILHANPAALAIYGLAPALGAPERLAQLPESSFSAAALAGVHRQLQDGTLALANWEGRRKVADGHWRDLRFSAWRIDWEGESATQLLITDDTERIASARELQHQASHDELTGLPNRSVLMERLAQCCLADRSGAPHTLVVLNIDRFKLFNQSQGHLAGDRVLLAFAAKLRAALGAGAELMRLGGDEFAILEPGAAGAREMAQRLRAVCAQPLAVADGEFFIDASMGMAVYPLNAAEPDALLRAANAAMYQAKRTPGTALALAEQRFELMSSQALEQEQALRKGIRNQEIHLHFQPKVDATTGRLLAFEALARWHRPGIGDISPVEFIAIAEHTGLIAELGAMLLREACRQIALWRAAFGECVPVAVNVSPVQLLDPGFLQLVEQALAQHGVPARYLTLEITESAAVDNLDDTRQQLQQLRELGVQVAMDDFGTGFSSLSMLRNLPLHTLKIDRALIDPLPAADAVAVVRAICQLADALQLRVVAEGIETSAHALAARLAGCHELQGFHFARPMPPQEATQWLRLGLEGAPTPELAGVAGQD